MGTAVKVRFRCPCCQCLTLDAPEALELCPVCWWEDDGQDGAPDSAEAAEVRSTVNGDLSLSHARANYEEFGASDARFVRFVRKALPEEE